MKKWIVTEIDTSDYVDGRKIRIGVCAHRDDAVDLANKTMNRFIENANANNITIFIDWNEYSIQSSNSNYCRRWEVDYIYI